MYYYIQNATYFLAYYITIERSLISHKAVLPSCMGDDKNEHDRYSCVCVTY